MKMPIVISLLLLITRPGFSQRDQKQHAIEELQKLTSLYKNTNRLSFDVTYRYAAEENADAWLDSLSGHCRLSGARYWYDVNNMESIRTDQYVILLFKEDQVMYLARPKGALEDDAGAAMANPAAQLEAFLKKDSTIICEVSHDKAHKKITINFSEPGVYKRIEYYTNRKTGYLEKMKSWVRTDQLYDASVQHLVEANNNYAIVEAVYTNYKLGAFEENFFSTENYFRKDGDEYVTVAPYQTYKIFQGTPNL
jgi:hypothetical protein